MNIIANSHADPASAALADMSPHARELLHAAAGLDLSQRRLLATALRPGPRREQQPATPVRSEPRHLWLSANREARAARRALFSGPNWRDLYRPGTQFHVYVIGTPGLQTLAVELGVSLAKIGTCNAGQFGTRLSRLRRDGYGNMVRCGAKYVVEPGFDEWCPPPRLQLAATPPLGPVGLSVSSLIVTLPAGISHGLFEYDLNKALSSISLARFADSDDGRAWCAARGVDPRRLIRYTGSSGEGRPQAALEIGLFRPQADTPALAGVIEDIVSGYLGLGPLAAVSAGAIRPAAESWA